MLISTTACQEVDAVKIFAKQQVHHGENLCGGLRGIAIHIVWSTNSNAFWPRCAFTSDFPATRSRVKREATVSRQNVL